MHTYRAHGILVGLPMRGGWPDGRAVIRPRFKVSSCRINGIQAICTGPIERTDEQASNVKQSFGFS